MPVIVPKLYQFYPAVPLKELTSFYTVGNHAFDPTPASGNTPGQTHRVAVLSMLPKTLMIHDLLSFNNKYTLLLESVAQVTSITWKAELFLNGIKIPAPYSFIEIYTLNLFEYTIYFKQSILDANKLPKFDQLLITCEIVKGAKNITLQLQHLLVKATDAKGLLTGTQSIPFAGEPDTYNYIANQLNSFLPKEPLQWNGQPIEVIPAQQESLLSLTTGVLYYNIQTAPAMGGYMLKTMDMDDFSNRPLKNAIFDGSNYTGDFQVGLGRLPLHILSDALDNINDVPNFTTISDQNKLYKIISDNGIYTYNDLESTVLYTVPQLLQQSKDRLLADQNRLIALYHYCRFPASAIKMTAILIKFLFQVSKKNMCNECKDKENSFLFANIENFKETPNFIRNILTHYFRTPYNKIETYSVEAVKAAALCWSPYVYSLRNAIKPRILKAYFAKRLARKIGTDAQHFFETDFERADSSMFTDSTGNLLDDSGANRLDGLGNTIPKPSWSNFLGHEVYLVVETLNCKGKTVRCTIQSDPDVFTVGKNGNDFIVKHESIFESNLERLIGNGDALKVVNVFPGTQPALTEDYIKVNHENRSIYRIRLRPETDIQFRTWTNELASRTDVCLQLKLELTTGEQCIWGNDTHTSAVTGNFLSAADKYNNTCRYRVENRISYEIHHPQNPWKRTMSATAAVRIGKINNRYVSDFIVQQTVGTIVNHKVAYFYYDDMGYLHDVLDCKAVRAIQKDARTEVIPAVANRGNLISTVNYAPNIANGEGLDMHTLQIYDNGSLATGTYSQFAQAWYPNANADPSIILVQADVLEEIKGANQGGDVFMAFYYKFRKLQLQYGFKDTRRRFINADLLAGFIGALCKFRLDGNANNLSGEGFSFQDGSCYPSTSHRNGMAGDLYYLETADNDATETLLSNANFDFNSQNEFNDLLHEYGYARGPLLLSERFQRNGNTVIVNRAAHITVPRHNNHLHIQGFDFADIGVMLTQN